MNASQVIETYIDDTVRLLPRRQRTDVACELRSLLTEELHLRAQRSGESPDETLALSMVREFGRPNEVAARYQHQPTWAIIDPADSGNFIRAAILGAGTLILFAAICQRPFDRVAIDDFLKIGILVWLGLLVVAFGARSWIGRRWPRSWVPRDRDRVNRLGIAVVVPLAACCVVLYAVPTWVLTQLSGGRLDVSWAPYTTDFEQLRLPGLIGLLTALLALLVYVAIRGRRTRLMRRIDIGLNLVLACLVLASASDGNIFQSSHADRIAQDVLTLVGAIYLPFVAVLIYGELGRVDRAVVAPRRTAEAAR
jgi:hypothetical protein